MAVASIMKPRIGRILGRLPSREPDHRNADEAVSYELGLVLEGFDVVHELQGLGAAAVEPLIELANKPDLPPRRRMAVLRALGRLEDPRATPVVTEWMTKGEPGVVGAALDAAGRLAVNPSGSPVAGSDALRSQELFESICRCSESSDPSIRCDSVKAVALCAPSQAVAMPILTRLAGDLNEDVRRCAIEALTELTQVVDDSDDQLRRAIDATLVAALGDRDPAVIDTALAYLLPLRPELLDAVLAVPRRRARNREAVVRLILPSTDPRVVPVLEEVLAQRPKAWYRIKILERFAELGRPDLTGHLEQALEDPRVRATAMEGLGRMGDVDAVPLLLCFLRTPPHLPPFSPPPSDCLAALKALETIGGEHAVRALVDQLASGDENLRGEIAATLARMEATLALPALKRQLDEEDDYEVRAILANVVAELEHVGKPPQDAIQASLDDPDPKVVTATLAGLSLPELETHIEEVEFLLDHPKSGVRKAARSAIAKLVDPQIREMMTRRIAARLEDDEKPTLMVHLIDALGALGDAAHIPQLLEYVTHFDGRVRPAAERALTALGCDPQILEQRRRIHETRNRLLAPRETGLMAAAPELLPALRALAVDFNDETWCLAARLLQRLEVPYHSGREQAARELMTKRITDTASLLGVFDEILRAPMNRRCPQIATAMMGAVAGLGEGAKPYLFEALSARKPFRQAAADALIEADLWRFEEIALLLADPDPGVVQGASFLLGRSGDPRAVEMLGEAIAAAKTDARLSTILSSVEALGELGRAEAVPLLGQVMADCPRAVDRVIRALVRIGKPEACLLLLNVMRSRADGPGILAAKGLADLGFKPRNTSDAAYFALQRSDWHALRRLGTDALRPLNDYLPKLLARPSITAFELRSLLEIYSCFEDPTTIENLVVVGRFADGATRNEVIGPTLQRLDPGRVSTVIAREIEHGHNRPWLARVAAGLHTDCEQHRSLLIALLDDSEVGVRRAAASGVGRLRERRAVPGLMRCLHIDDPVLKRHAVEALGRIGDPSVLPALTKLTAPATHDDHTLAQVVAKARVRLGE